MTRDGAERTRADRCPGVLRPWIAADGALVRLRLVGGEMTAQMLTDLMRISTTWADGTVLLTKRANLQLRGIEHRDGCVPVDFVDAVTEAGFLPQPSHELVRNIMVSPLSGRFGGRVDLYPAAHYLDDLLCSEPEFAELSARFLFVLDDGRGDIIDRTLDLGAMAVDDEHAQLRVGADLWGEVVQIKDDLAPALADLARRFLRLRGTGEDAPWHVAELAEPLIAAHARDLRTQVTSPWPPTGTIVQDYPEGPSGQTLVVDVPDGVLTHELATPVLARAERSIIVTPWRSLLLTDLGHLTA